MLVVATGFFLKTPGNFYRVYGLFTIIRFEHSGVSWKLLMVCGAASAGSRDKDMLASSLVRMASFLTISFEPSGSRLCPLDPVLESF